MCASPSETTKCLFQELFDQNHPHAFFHEIVERDCRLVNFALQSVDP